MTTAHRIKRPRLDLTPIIFINAKHIQQQHLNRPLVALLDSGSTGTMINRASFPYGVITSRETPKTTVTTNGTFNSCEQVQITSCKCPEFGSRSIPDIKADVFDSHCCFDMIIGRDLLEPIGIKLDFGNDTVQWIDHTIPMKQAHEVQSHLAQHQQIPSESTMETEDSELFSDEMLDRKYLAVTPKEVIAQQNHLTADQREKLQHVLESH